MGMRKFVVSAGGGARDGMGLYFRFFVNKWQAAALLSDMAVEVVVTCTDRS